MEKEARTGGLEGGAGRGRSMGVSRAMHMSGERAGAAAAEAAGPGWMQLWAENVAPAQQGEESLSPFFQQI